MPKYERALQRSRTIHAAALSLEERSKDLTLEQILRATLDEAEALTGSCIGFYHFVEEDQENLLLQAWSSRTEAEFCTAEGKGMHYPVSKAGVWADCLRVGHPLIHNDYQNLPNRQGLPPGHATVLRELVVPVKRSGRVMAVLGVGNKATDYDQSDIESVQLLADLAWHLAESKQSERKLRQEKERLSRIFQASYDAIYVSDLETGAYVDVNPAFERIIGYSCEEVIGRTSSDLNLWFNPEHLIDYYKELHATGRVHNRLICIRHRCGQEVWAECNSSLMDIDGRQCMVSMARDVTDRILRERILQETELSFQKMLEAAPIPIGVANSTGKIEYLNMRFIEEFGYTREDLPDMEAWWKLAYPDPDYRQWALGTWTGAHHQASQRGGDVSMHETFKITCSNGQVREVQIQGAQIGTRVIVFILDQTDRIRGEEELRQSEARYRDLFNNAEVGMFRTQLDGSQVLEFNNKYLQIFGGTREELQQVPSTTLWSEPQRRLELIGRLKAEGHVSDFEFDLRNAQGELRHCVTSVKLYPDRGILEGSVQDITERKIAEDRLRESEEQFRLLFDRAPMGMAIMDSTTGRFLSSNPRMGEILECDHLQLHNHTFHEFTHPDHLVEDTGSVHSLAIGSAQEIHKEKRYLLKSGRTVWVRLKMVRLPSAPGLPPRHLSIVEDITEPKKSAEALQASEDRLQAIWNAEPECVKLVSPNGLLLDMNKAGLEMLEVDSREQVIGKPVIGMVVKEHHSRFMEIAQQAFKEGSGFGEFEIIGLKGTRRWMETHAVPLWDEASKTNLLLAVTRDINERKKAQELLLESRLQLQEAQLVAGLGYFVWDLSSGLFTSSQILDEIFGIDETYIRSLEGWVGLVHPNWRKTMADYVELEVVGKRLIFDKEYQIIRKVDNEVRWVHGLGKIELDNDNRPARLIGTIQDISKRKQAEEALRASETRFHDIATASGDWIWEVDANARYTYASGNVMGILGYSAEEVLGKTPFDLMPPEEAVRVGVIFDGIASRKEPFRDLDNLNLHRDGSLRHILTNGMPILDPDGNLLGYRGMDRDVTEQKKQDQERRELEAHLHQAQKMESLGILAGGIAHDMNNVLGAILGLASANVQIQPEGSPAQNSFETIAKAASRGGEMVRGLLAFARQSQGEERTLDLNVLLKEEISLLERTTLARVELRLDLEPDLHSIKGDAGALTHAFMNLCVNAVDAMPDDGTLTIRTRNVGRGWTEVVVEDTGTGMPKEVLEKAMDPFFTTKEVGKGTGLGLSMVYRTVKAHRGQIEIQSKPGKGTIVRMRFPTCEPPGKEKESDAGTLTETSRRSLNVLLVDDDELIQSSMEAVLQTLGHDVSISRSGEEALATIEAGFQPDVVILDMNMPGLGGIGTLPRLRAMLPTVPVLLSTGRTDQAALNLSKAHPLVTLLPKPFSMKEIQRRLESFKLR